MPNLANESCPVVLRNRVHLPANSDDGAKYLLCYCGGIIQWDPPCLIIGACMSPKIVYETVITGRSKIQAICGNKHHTFVLLSFKLKTNGVPPCN